MPTEAEIKTTYKAQHDTLTASYYGGNSGLTKEEFNLQHGQIWQNMTAELIANGYLSEPELPIAFIPVNPELGVAQRIQQVEDFLSSLYPP